MKTPKTSQEMESTFSKTSLSLPRVLLEKIDQAARGDSRSRSSWLVLQLEKMFSELPKGTASTQADAAPHRPRPKK